MLELVKPSIKYRKQYVEMMQEWEPESKIYIAPWPLKLAYKTEKEFLEMIEKLESRSKGLIDDDCPLSDTYWIYKEDGDKLIGAINIRKFDEKHKLDIWGHIGYGIRPSERKKGYATEILRQAKNVCKNMGLDKIMLACYEWNKGSEKVMINNGGVLKDTIIEDETGDVIKLYEISL